MPDVISSMSNDGGGNWWGLPSTIPYRDLIIGRKDVGIAWLDTAGWSNHRHSHVQLVLPGQIDSGQMQWTASSNGELCVCQLGSRPVCFIAPEVQHTVILSQKTEVVVLLVRRHFVERVLGGQKWVGVVLSEFAVLLAQDRMIWWLASICLRLCRKADSSDHPLIEEIGRGLVRRLFAAQFDSPAAADTNDTVLTPVQLKKLTDHIEADWKRVRTVGELAKLVGLSREHFSRVFKKTTGVSPARYQRICRMQKAQEMLRSGNYRIEEVAFALGFKDASYFSRCFREDFEMSPSEYVKEHRGRIS